MLKVTLQFFGHWRWSADSLESALKLGKTEGKRRRGRQRMRWSESITDSMGMNPSKLQEIMKHRRAWRTAIHRVTKSWTCVKRRKNNNNKMRRLVCIHLHLCSLPLSLHMYMCEVHMATCAGNGLESERCMKPPGQQLVGSMKIIGNYRFTRHEVCTDERRAG